MQRRETVPSGMPQRDDVRDPLRNRQAPGKRAGLVAMHLDEGIGTGLQRGDRVDGLGAFHLRGIRRQGGIQLVAHVLQVERIADGEGVVDRLFDTETCRSKHMRAGRAPHEPQQCRPVELRQGGRIEAHPLTNPDRKHRRSHCRPLCLTVGKVGCQGQGAKDFGERECLGGAWSHIEFQIARGCAKHCKQRSASCAQKNPRQEHRLPSSSTAKSRVSPGGAESSAE